jgi:hypothetical protein
MGRLQSDKNIIECLAFINSITSGYLNKIGELVDHPNNNELFV